MEVPLYTRAIVAHLTDLMILIANTRVGSTPMLKMSMLRAPSTIGRRVRNSIKKEMASRRP